MTATRLAFVKGHGTENDFLLVTDPDGVADVPAATVARLCDRRAGVGADGLIRAVRCDAVPEGRALVAAAGAQDGPGWFMDYRNADGTVAEMCGNGLRVFVAHLVRSRLVDLADGETLQVGTRAGVKRVARDGALLAADLGPWSLPGGPAALRDGHDVAVMVRGAATGLPGLRVDVGNPHVVVALPDAAALAALDLTEPPGLSPALPEGANVEFVVPSAPAGDGTGRLAMRVHERGVGETRSCGTGAVAAVLAARAWGGAGSPLEWQVTVPGGRLRVRVPSDGLLAADGVELAGPAVIVAEGEVLLAAAEAPQPAVTVITR